MRILHVPFNISSQASASVRGLRALGMEVRGLVRHISPYQDHTGIESFNWTGKVGPISRLTRGLRWRWKLIRAMHWADVIHWHWGDSTWRGWDLRFAAWQGKPRLVEYWGDDLRDPEMASRDNPYIERMYRQYPEFNVNNSRPAQEMFRRYGFACLVPSAELADYVRPDIFPDFHEIRQRICLEDFIPQYPNPVNPKPLLVHAPSDKAKKGTEAVLAAVEQLQKQHHFEFKLLHQMSRADALELVKQCDIFLDQFTVGAEGMASLEAMALGKPVLCYIKPALLSRYPRELPIVAANQDNLQAVVAGLLADGPRRAEIGRRSRQYIEQYHDARKLAAELITIYRKLGGPIDP